MRLIGRLALAVLALAFASAAQAQTTFPTPAGSAANGAVAMCPSTASAALKVPCDATNPLAVSIAGGSDAVTVADGADVTQGATTDAACATDNGACTVEAVLKRIAQRVTSLITALGSPFQAGGSIGNTSFGNRPIGSASSADGIVPVVGGSAASSLVLKASPGNLYSVYANCTAACWLMVFNRIDAPTNGATTAGVASGNMVECVPIAAGGVGSIGANGMPPSVYSVGMTAAISSTNCATLTLATTGFINGKVQ